MLYLHDGQNLFDGATSFIPGQEWQVDETAQRLIAAGKIEPLIIVGINNAGKDRINEYTPIQDARLLQEALVKKGWKPGKDLNYFEAEGAEHNERAWAHRVEPILRFLFPQKL